MAENTRMIDKRYDVVIIGGGPAGLSAAIYCSRGRLSTLLLERALVGGQIVNAEQVDNYPGFPTGINGLELTQQMHCQADRYGLETVYAEATALELCGTQKLVSTTEGIYTARAVIIACGSQRQKLGIPGEDEFTGKGVSYCATCDAAFFRDKTVALVGGGNAALSEALHLSRFADRVIVIHRRERLRATPVVQEKAFATGNIEFRLNAVVTAIEGEEFVSRVKLRHVGSGEESYLPVSGIFIAIGFKPNTDFLRGLLPLDEKGAVITGDGMQTAISGIFAAGDIRRNSIRQVIAAAGDGAIAAVSAEKYLTE